MALLNYLLRLSCVILLTFLSQALRNNYEDSLTPDYSEFYYYHNLEEKMAETMSINNCTLSSKTFTGFEPRDGEKGDFSVQIIEPPTSIKRKWGTEGDELHLISKIYIKVTESLCSSKQFIDFKRGHFKNSKGCQNMYRTDRDTGKRVKVIKRYGATLHPDHIRCNTKDAASVCVAASKNLEHLPVLFRSLNTYPFLITAQNVIVSRSGFLSLPCGPVGLFSGCEAVGRGVPYAAEAVSSVQICRDSVAKMDKMKMWARTDDQPNNAALSVSSSSVRNTEVLSLQNSTGDCPFPTYDRVFIMAQYDDTQIGQFMQESLPRLVYHLDFLLANPDIKIQYGFTKKPVLPSSVMTHTYIKFLGISLDRLINGTAYAKEAFMPREGGCQDPGYNAWEIVTMRERFFRIANIDDSSQVERVKRYIIVICRSNFKFTNNKSDYRRWWPAKELAIMLEELQRTFPSHEIKVFSDKDTELMTCIKCHIDLFYHADIVIGHHGAGLMNTLYMRRGGIVVEVLPYFDSRLAPITGIFARVSGIIGLHHFSYYIGDNGQETEITGNLAHVVVITDAKKLVQDVHEYAVAVGMDLRMKIV